MAFSFAETTLSGDGCAAGGLVKSRHVFNFFVGMYLLAPSFEVAVSLRWVRFLRLFRDDLQTPQPQLVG